MTFEILCKNLHSRTAGELAAAKSREQKELILVAALQEYGRSPLEYLKALAQKDGADSPAYLKASETAAQLLASLALPFLSSCTSYKHGIGLFEELAQNCPDQALSRRCTIYATQLKRRWNDADPSALPINPRARKVVREDAKSDRLSVGLLLILLPIAILMLVHLYQNSPLLKAAFSSPEIQTAPVPPVPRQESERGEPESVPLPQAGPEAVSDEYYSYTDANGVVRLGNKRTPPSGSTPVIINGNRVLVPVTLSYRGRSVNLTLLLDTGASITTINERCAMLLGVEPGQTEQGISTVADGREVPTSLFVADSIVVGPSRLVNIRTSILSRSGGAEHDGLLGMDVLKNFRYHIDFSRKVIQWG